MKKTLPYAAVIFLTVLMIFFPQITVRQAKNCAAVCGEIIIPSLFPFFVCSGLIVRSGIAERTSVFAKPIMKPLFKISENGAPAFVMGLLSGYPTGAVTACELYKNGSIGKEEAERLLAFCNNSGPLFILGAVGSAMFGSVRIGTALYAAHIAAAVSVGIIFGFFGKYEHPNSQKKQNEIADFADVFPAVLSASTDNMLTVCGAIMFFGTASGIVCALLPGDTAKTVFGVITELTSGIKALSALDVPMAQKLILSAFSVGFAGLCVHLQVASVCFLHDLDLKPYFFGKILHGVISAAYMTVIMQIFSVTETVFLRTPEINISAATGSAFSSVSVVSVILLAFAVRLISAKRKNRHGLYRNSF